MKYILILAGLFFVNICFSHNSEDSSDKDRWNKKYSGKSFHMGTHPISFLQDNLPLLPKGKVLDLAMGEGRNGVFLAKNGFDVTGVDISDIGLKKAQELAKKNKTSIKTIVADLTSYRLEENAYDVIILSYYLQRDLFPQIKKSLKKDGVVVIESYNEDYAKYNPKFNKEWMLKRNELVEQFSDLFILRFQNVDDGKTTYSSLLAKKL